MLLQKKTLLFQFIRKIIIFSFGMISILHSASKKSLPPSRCALSLVSVLAHSPHLSLPPQITLNPKSRFIENDIEALKRFGEWLAANPLPTGDKSIADWTSEAANHLPTVLLSMQVPDSLALPFLPTEFFKSGNYSLGEAYLPFIFINMSLQWLFRKPTGPIHNVNDLNHFLEESPILLNGDSLGAIQTLGNIPIHILAADIRARALWTIFAAPPEKFQIEKANAPTIMAVKEAAAKALFGSYWLITNSPELQIHTINYLFNANFRNDHSIQTEYAIKAFTQLLSSYRAFSRYPQSFLRQINQVTMRILEQSLPAENTLLESNPLTSDLQKAAWELGLEYSTQFLFKVSKTKKNTPGWIAAYTIKSREELSQSLGYKISQKDYLSLTRLHARLFAVLSNSKMNLKLANQFRFAEEAKVIQTGWTLIRPTSPADLKDFQEKWMSGYFLGPQKKGLQKYWMLEFNPESMSLNFFEKSE